MVDGLAVRGAASSGFRAPTPGQSNYSDAQTNVLVATGQSLFTGTLGVSNPIARFFGSQPLKPEESTNLTAGIVMGPFEGWTATVDYFNIKVKDRIGVTANINVTAANVAAMQAQGIQNADQFQAVRFFGNFFDTRTQGIDFVVTKKWTLNDGTVLDFSSALNYKKNKVTAVRDTRAIDRERRLELEKFDPNWRANATIGYEKGKFSALARANYYGTWVDAIFIPATPNDTSLDQKFSAKVLVDLEASYQVTDIVTLTIGGNNVLDTFPEKDTRTAQKNLGVVYPQFSPFGYNGGFWYARVTAKF
jgi:iron complex outermembrane receptor protein